MPNPSIAATGEAMPEAGLLPQSQPVFLRDVIAMKRERGDADIEDFKGVCRQFGSSQYATINGAAYAMRQWVRKSHPSKSYQAKREAFLADLEGVLAGTFFHRAAA